MPQCHRPSSTLAVETKYMRQPTHLLDGLGGQNNRVVVTNTHAVLNADANATEVFRPPIFVRDVDTAANGLGYQTRQMEEGDARFDSNTLTRLEVVAPRISRAVVDIQANVVAQMVREENTHRLPKSACHITTRHNQSIRCRRGQNQVVAADLSTHPRQCCADCPTIRSNFPGKVTGNSDER